MDKLTYLAELAEGLARWVPERERQDILRYYAEYFEEAGPDKEGQVVAELGDPWALSCRLAVEGGYITQEKADSWTPRQNKRRRWPLVLAGTVACVAIVALSVGRMASDVGRAIGRWVSDRTANVAQVEEGIGFVTIPKAEPGVEYIDGWTLTGGFWSEKDGNLDLFLSIDAEIGLGNITVTEGEDFSLAIQYTSELGYALEWEVKDGVLKIRDDDSPHVEVNSWDDFWNLFGANTQAADVTITVPQGTLLEKVEAKTGLGNVYLSGLYVKKTEAKTGMGNMECYELRAQKKLELKTGTGNVTLGLNELYDGVDIDAKTGMGQIEAILDCPEQDCRYEVKTGTGIVTVSGQARGTKAERGGSGPYKLELSSGTGDIHLAFDHITWIGT